MKSPDATADPAAAGCGPPVSRRFARHVGQRGRADPDSVQFPEQLRQAVLGWLVPVLAAHHDGLTASANALRPGTPPAAGACGLRTDAGPLGARSLSRERLTAGRTLAAARGPRFSLPLANPSTRPPPSGALGGSGGGIGAVTDSVL